MESYDARLIQPGSAALGRKLSKRINALDPRRDCREIVFLLSAYVFPWDIEKALEFALFRSYAVPAISGLLCATGEFIQRPRKRYDDTELILAEILENGFDSHRGQAALRRLNEMRGRYRIANADFLYVLSTFIFEPIRWLERYGWRQPRTAERLAFFHYYCELGHRMHIADIPADYQEFERYNIEYERDQFRFAESNMAIGAVTRDLLLSFYMPKFLIPMARPVAHAFLDEPLLRAMGFPKPPRFLRMLVSRGLALRAGLIRWLPERRRPHLLTRVRRPTYPDGHEVEKLGTFES